MNEWPRMALIVNEVAGRLQGRYGESGIPSEALKREIERVGGYAKESVLPSDFCYNRINRAPFSCQHPVLIQVGRGLYKYLGPGFAYTGPVVWKPKHGTEQQIGNWIDGSLHMDTDPRLSVIIDKT